MFRFQIFFLLISYFLSELRHHGERRRFNEAIEKLRQKCVKKSLKKKVAKSSRHLNVFRRRLKKWVNESDRGNIVIESMSHPLKNYKALLSLRQFRMNKEKKNRKLYLEI